MGVGSSKHGVSLRGFLEGPRNPIALWLLVVLFPLSRSLAIPLAYDTAQEWSLARACLDRGECSEGLRSSLLDVQHGRLVVWLIQIALRFHLPSWVLVATVTGLVGVAAVVWLRATQSILGTALTWPFLLLAAAVVAKGDRLFWNLTPHPIATALFAAALLRVVATGHGAGWAALALGFATDLHIGSPVLAPILAFVVAWCSNRPGASAALSVVATLVGPLLFSPSVWLRNLHVVLRLHSGIAMGLAGLTVVAFASGLALRPLRRRCSDMSTAMLVSAGASLLVATIGWVALWKQGADAKSGVEHMALSVRPLQAFLLAGVLALLAARLGDAWRRGLARVGSTAMVGAVLLQTGILAGFVPSARFADPLQWYLGDVEKVVSVLQARSMGQDAAVRHLWTNQSVDVLSFSSSYLPAHLGGPDDKGDLMVLKVPSRLVPSSLPPGWSQIPSDTGGATLLLHEFRSQIDLEHVGVWSTDPTGQTRHLALTRMTGYGTSDYARSVDFRWQRVESTEPPHSFRVLRDVGAEGPASSSCGLGCAYAELVATTLDGQAHEVPCHAPQSSEKGVIVRVVGPTGAQAGQRWRRDFRPDLVEFTPEDADLLGAVFPPREAWTCR